MPLEPESTHQLSPSSSISSKQKSPAASSQATPYNRDKSEKSYDEDSSDTSNNGDEEEEDNFDVSMSHLIGTKCQAPIKNDWGGHHYGNAMIWSIEAPSELDHHSEYRVIGFVV